MPAGGSGACGEWWTAWGVGGARQRRVLFPVRFNSRGAGAERTRRPRGNSNRFRARRASTGRRRPRSLPSGVFATIGEGRRAREGTRLGLEREDFRGVVPAAILQKVRRQLLLVFLLRCASARARRSDASRIMREGYTRDLAEKAARERVAGEPRRSVAPWTGIALRSLSPGRSRSRSPSRGCNARCRGRARCGSG